MQTKMQRQWNSTKLRDSQRWCCQSMEWWFRMREEGRLMKFMSGWLPWRIQSKKLTILKNTDRHNRLEISTCISLVLRIANITVLGRRQHTWNRKIQILYTLRLMATRETSRTASLQLPTSSKNLWSSVDRQIMRQYPNGLTRKFSHR